MPRPVQIAVIGAGAIGRRHAALLATAEDARLAALIDLDPGAATPAAALGVPWHPDLAAALAAGPRPDGVIVATPNPAHLQNGLDCIAAGLPVLVEKPLCDTVAAAETLVAAAESAGVALLTGHHRRHNPVMQKAREIIASGAIGRVVVGHAMVWLCKPDTYFDTAWRREPGAGPVIVNLIHDIDNLRFLLGEVAAVTARESNAVRGLAVEDTAAVLLEFASGALVTASACDATVAPWSWEMTAAENPAYPHTGESCYLIGGTEGSLALPGLELRRNAGARGWHAPFDLHRPGVAPADPLARQIAQFAAVIRAEAPPLVSGRDGLETLRVVDAIKRSAAGGGRVAP